MKQMMTALLLAAMILSLAACGNGSDGVVDPADAPQTEAPISPAPEPENGQVTETNYMRVEGLYVDNSYRDKNNDKLRMVYLFYTVFTEAENLKVDSKSTKVTVNGVNTYQAEHYPGVCSYMSSYYYSDYLEEVYIGDALQVVETFKIPEGDLSAGKELSFSKSQVPETDDLRMTTDDISFCDDVMQIAKAADPEGYADESYKREAADEAAVSRVRQAIDGYYWTFYVNATTYELEFYAPYTFTLSAIGASNSGTYSVTNGYILCQYDSTGYVVELPYEFEGDEIKLDVIAAFDVKAS